MIGWLKRIGSGLWVSFALILAVIIGGLRMFYRGKESERAQADAAASKDEARKVKEAGKRGDADAVLDSFRRATDKEKP